MTVMQMDRQLCPDYVWERRDKPLNLVVTWCYLVKHIPNFNPVSGKCKLCTREEFQIIVNPCVFYPISKPHIDPNFEPDI